MTEPTLSEPLAELDAIRPAIRANLSPAELIEHAIRHGSAQFAANGALCATTAPRTGRSVKDRFIARR